MEYQHWWRAARLAVLSQAMIEADLAVREFFAAEEEQKDVAEGHNVEEIADEAAHIEEPGAHTGELADHIEEPADHTGELAAVDRSIRPAVAEKG